MKSQITSRLKQVAENIWRVNSNVDLVYSELDEEEKGTGWYLQKYPGGKCSQLFRNDYEALKSLKEDKVVFNK
jgi:hypothetical protein